MNASSHQLNDANFEALVLNSESTVLVDFWADWCGPCRALSPVIEELAAEFDGKAIVGKLNVDANPETAKRFGVESLPTVVVFRDGEIVETLVGARPLDRYVLALNQAISQTNSEEKDATDSSSHEASCGT